MQLAGGVPFIPDDQLNQALTDAGVDEPTAAGIVAENETARLNGLRSALSALAVVGGRRRRRCSSPAGIPTRWPVCRYSGRVRVGCGMLAVMVPASWRFAWTRTPRSKIMV